MRRSPSTIDSLDGLRGMAAIGVVVLHGCQRLGLGRPGYSGHLYLAVPLFFVLSGYVVARSYEARLSAGMTVGGFMLVRAIRLGPLLAASCLLAWMLGAPVGLALATALLIPARGGLELFPANGPVWSLFLEYWGNLTHALLLPALNYRALTALILLGAAGTIGGALTIGDLSVGWAHGNLAAGVAVFVFAYGVGVLIWRLERDGRDPWRLPVPFAWIVLAYGLAVGWPQLLDGRWSGARDALVVIGVFPLLLLAARHATMPGWAARLCRTAGALSYPLYVLHYPLLCVVTDRLRPVTTPVQGYGIIAAFMPLCLAVAWIAERLVDRPSRAWLGRHLPLARTPFSSARPRPYPPHPTWSA